MSDIKANRPGSTGLDKSGRTRPYRTAGGAGATRRSAGTLLVALALTVTLTACATDDPNRRTKVGAGIGAVAGAVIGNQVGGKDTTSRVLGAAIGALAGAAVGRYQDQQQKALEEALEEERRQEQVEIDRLENDVLLVSMSDDASFAIDSAELKPAFTPTLDKIADQMQNYDKTILHVVGHTDDTGAEAYNQQLSERRAESVARYLRGQGVMRERLMTEGRGELEPRVENTSAPNRAMNRRVEVYITPVVEGRQEEALERPLPS